MDRWQILSYVVVGGIGVLAFMRIVANEVMLINQALLARQEVEQEERAKALKERKEKEAAEETPVKVEAA